MKYSSLIAALLLVGFAVATPHAQPAKAKPEFKDAPVTDVLRWAQDTTGVGFIYEGKDLNDPATGKVRTVTAASVNPATDSERKLLLLELLRRAGLVAFEVGGLPGPTYQLYTAADAARNAPIVEHPDQLAELYYATLSVRLSRNNVQSVAPRVREQLSAAGKVEVFEATHAMLISDFADRLQAAWTVVLTAEQPALRDDDLVIEDFVAVNGEAIRFLAAAERLRESGESWKASLNETTNAILLSGRRDEVDTVLARLRKLDSRPQDPAFAETTTTLKLVYAEPGDVAATLRDMFGPQVSAGAVQVGAFPRDRKIVFRGSKADLTRAEAALKVLDIQPEKK